MQYMYVKMNKGENISTCKVHLY